VTLWVLPFQVHFTVSPGLIVISFGLKKVPGPTSTLTVVAAIEPEATSEIRSAAATEGR
jgi:hypothetical protein